MLVRDKLACILVDALPMFGEFLHTYGHKYIFLAL